MTAISRRSAAAATLVGNGLTVAITVAQAVLLIPLCLRYLDPALYSGWLAASELLIWIQLLDGGLPNLLMQRSGALAGRDDWAGAARWTSTVLLLLAIIGACVLAGAVVLAPLIADGLGVHADYRQTFVTCFRLGAASSVLLMLSNGCIGLSRGVQRTRLINATQVTAAAIGLVTAAVLLTSGWGLLALATGLLARALIAAAGSLMFLVRLPVAPVSWWASPSRGVARELGGLVPAMSAANVGYVLANNTEVLLVTTMFGPTPALAYALTRRAFDGVRNLLDTIAWAVAGGFAHLVTAPDRHRSREVLGEILRFRLAAASLAVAIAVATNEMFVTLLFGASNFGGVWLTVAFGAQVIFAGQSFLLNYLWRSTGRVREGSLGLAAEAAVRVLAMAFGLAVAGVLGAPVASALVSLAALVFVGRRLRGTLPGGSAAVGATPVIWAPVGIVVLISAWAFWPAVPSWPALLTRAAAVTVVGSVWMWVWLPARLTTEILQQWRAR